jgi:hypothetical protein
MKLVYAAPLFVLVLVGAGCANSAIESSSVSTGQNNNLIARSQSSINDEAYNTCMQHAQDTHDSEVQRLNSVQYPTTYTRDEAKAAEDRLRTDRDFCLQSYPHDAKAVPPPSAQAIVGGDIIKGTENSNSGIDYSSLINQAENSAGAGPFQLVYNNRTAEYYVLGASGMSCTYSFETKDGRSVQKTAAELGAGDRSSLWPDAMKIKINAKVSCIDQTGNSHSDQISEF